MKVLSKSLLVAVILSIVASVTVFATSFTQGYQASGPLSLGTVVSLSQSSSTTIEPTTTDSDTRTVGVAADATNAIIDLQPKGTNIRVAVSGDAQVLVTNSSGDIKKGDSLIISPLAGIAMKDSADSAASKYIGVAQESFSKSSKGSKQVSVVLSNGKSKDISVGLINVNILLSDRRPGQNQQNSSLLAKIGEHITGRQVSSIRVVASAAVLVSIFSVTGWMLNASIKGSFVSLGRNPLARLSILTNLMRVIMIALVIFAAGLTASYLVLAL